MRADAHMVYVRLPAGNRTPGSGPPGVNGGLLSQQLAAAGATSPHPHEGARPCGHLATFIRVPYDVLLRLAA